jgi:hypothetical protein
MEFANKKMPTRISKISLIVVALIFVGGIFIAAPMQVR